ncbi:MAG: phospho-sugar mutase, partial [Lachnospiraceae bacterium]|nr:phospho-sugar mutase [Lachnospiraceae bacterium]
MTGEEIRARYGLWQKKASADADLAEELKDIAQDDSRIEDAFYRDLEFGTGGLRGVIGAGTNRMNVYTVAKASQGLADYVKKHFPKEEQKIAVSYDSRIKSDVFAQVASGVFAANGISVVIYRELMPTPCLSYAVRSLCCAAGIMVTASHNPSRYNGYKVYGSDGCQITTQAAADIQEEIEKLDIFEDVRTMEFEAGRKAGLICYIPDEVYTAFVEEVKGQSLLAVGETVDRQVAIIYTPLNGTGRGPVLRTLRESGYTNITVVKEQELPDGQFPTCPYPNPEIFEALRLGLELAKKSGADLMLATDPDADRVGIAIKCPDGSYELVSGNEVGVLLLDYICQGRIETGTMPQNPVAVKSIVSTPLADAVAKNYGVEMRNVLTGFKWIGDQIARLEAAGEVDRFLFGFEESYGYLAGPYVRDKDAIIGSMLICEMAAYYRSIGSSIKERLEAIYAKYG